MNSIDQKLVILTKALEERGLKKEAFIVRHICRDLDSMTKIAAGPLLLLPFIGTWLATSGAAVTAGGAATAAGTVAASAAIQWGIVAGITAAALGAGGTIHGYNAEDIDEELAARLNSKAEKVVADMNKLGSWGGADVEGGLVDFAIISGIKDDPTKFYLLYGEIARVLAGQDTELDLHWGWAGGQDSGDFSAFSNLEDRIVDRFEGKRMTMDELQDLLSENVSEFLEWGNFKTWENSEGEIINYVNAWNSLYELEESMADVLSQLVAQSSDNEEGTPPAVEAEEPDHTPVEPL